MDLLDCHNHTAEWSDGHQSIEQILECSRETGVRVGLADHAGVTDYLNSSDRLLAYADFLGQYPVARGLEMDLGRSFQVPPGVRSRFDFMIGSVHGLIHDGERHSFKHLLNFLHGREPEYDPRTQFGDIQVMLRNHLDLLKRELAAQKYDILGHCSLLPPLVLGKPEEVFPVWWEDGLVSVLREYDVALELSNRWRTPYPRLMGKAVAAGLRFSAGSDGHEPNRSCDLQYPQSLLAEFGVGRDRVFDVGRVSQQGASHGFI
jgi:histidinol phosphatase-like PHP family hydrolase